MATGAPESRVTHVTRILGTNKAGERLDHIWADVERIDIAKSAMQIPPDFQWQAVQRKLRWSDDPDGEDDYFPDGTPSRLTEEVKLCDPETQNVDDPDEWIPLRVTKGMRSKGGGSESMGQGFMDRFLAAVTDEDVRTARIFEVRKIPHYDTNIDDAAQAAFDADPSRTNYVVPGDFYTKDQSSKDATQYVEQEIITYLKHKTNSLAVRAEGRQTKVLSEYLIDQSDPPEGKKTGASGINPPYRLDPFQNIVNVKFSVSVIVVFVNDAISSSSGGSLVCEPLPDASGKEKAKLLENFTTTMPGESPVDIDCHAFKVPASASSFMRTTMPSVGDPLGTPNVGALVFAILPGETDDVAMARVKDLTRLAAIDLNTQDAGAIESGAVLCPDNLLWWAQTLNQCAPGSENVWTMRFGKHRGDNNTAPRNTMVQCYPINQSPASYTIPDIVSFTFSGYRIFYYRLDAQGTEQAYFVGNIETNPGCAWNAAEAGQAVLPPPIDSTSTFFGVLFGDPPPLIAFDRPKP